MQGLPDSISSQGFIKNATREKPILTKQIIFGGYNKDIVEPYYWHLNFAYYQGKQYFFIKLEDHHFFSENSQFGANLRQMKGGSVRALQENLQQLIQLVKVHLIPLLKEVKETDFYRSWMNEISENDNKYQQGLKQGKKKDDPKMQEWMNRRDEAINHIKDKWVNEVDGGRLWQMNKSSTEQGLDFALLPQLFFGTKLDNPLYMLHGEGPSIKEQLDNYTYKVDISTEAITQVARFHYRFYTWLPSAIKETQTTFKIKVASLKQFYSQFQMYMQFMKPLLLEIAKKSEGFEKTSMFYNFEEHNPEFWNLLDYSYSFVRVMGINKFKSELQSLESIVFDSHGLFVEGSQIVWGKNKGVSCIIFDEQTVEEDNKKYVVYYAKKFSGSREDASHLTPTEFNRLETTTLYKTDLKTYPCVEFCFAQKRRTDTIESQQGPMQVPYMTNTIDYKGVAWNVYEIASYREFLRQDDLKLLETFVEEIGAIREDLMYYIKVLEKDDYQNTNSDDEKENTPKQSQQKNTLDFSFLTLPFKGVWDLFSPLVGDITPPSRNKKSGYYQRKQQEQEKDEQNDSLEASKANVAEDLWKGYTIFKKSHGFIQY